MALSKTQIVDKERNRWFWLWERDLLECARRWAPWRNKAHELGFTDEKIDATWEHIDAGRLIKYMENPFYREVV